MDLSRVGNSRGRLRPKEWAIMTMRSLSEARIGAGFVVADHEAMAVAPSDRDLVNADARGPGVPARLSGARMYCISSVLTVSQSSLSSWATSLIGTCRQQQPTSNAKRWVKCGLSARKSSRSRFTARSGGMRGVALRVPEQSEFLRRPRTVARARKRAERISIRRTLLPLLRFGPSLSVPKSNRRHSLRKPLSTRSSAAMTLKITTRFPEDPSFV
jgi:hypothetical protein